MKKLVSVAFFSVIIFFGMNLNPSQAQIQYADQLDKIAVATSGRSSAAYQELQDSTQNDKVHLKSGAILEGKVKMVKTDIVEFVEKETGLPYELKKSDIKVIVLSSGKALTFESDTNFQQSGSGENQNTQKTSQPIIVKEEGGSSVALIILATVGIVLIVLLVVGAAAS